jgi:hypothetical protein
MKDTLSVDEFLSWQKETGQEYASRLVKGRKLTMSAYMNGLLCVSHGYTPLYTGRDANAACSAWNAVINSPMSFAAPQSLMKELAIKYAHMLGMLSNSRFPYTWHHDYVRTNGYKGYSLSRSDVASMKNWSEDELYATAFLQGISEMDSATSIVLSANKEGLADFITSCKAMATVYMERIYSPDINSKN